jgi:hypothetical protein
MAGKLADLVLVARPLRADPMSLIDIPIERTIVGGRWVHESLGLLHRDGQPMWHGECIGN